jgi:hypothetical protein
MIRHEQLTRAITQGILNRSRTELKKQAQAARRADFNAYRNEVRRLTELEPLHQVPGITLRGGSHHLDHIVSIRAAWLANWSAAKCAHLSNLQILPWHENLRKGDGCYCALDLSSRLTLS